MARFVFTQRLVSCENCDWIGYNSQLVVKSAVDQSSGVLLISKPICPECGDNNIQICNQSKMIEKKYCVRESD